MGSREARSRKLGNAAQVDPYGPRSPHYTVREDFAAYWTAGLAHCLERFRGCSKLYKRAPTGGIGCFTVDNFPVFDWMRPNVYVIADSNHGYKMYSEPKDIYLPFAYDPSVHYPEESMVIENGESKSTKDTDCVLIGMPYEQRVQWISELRKHGVSVLTENGPVFDEYRAIANRAKIGLNWSSMNDLNARFFETPAFGLAMVCNRVPDAPLFLEENEDYLGFSTLQEAVEKVLWLKSNPDRLEKIAISGYRSIQPHTYDARVDEILKECGF